MRRAILLGVICVAGCELVAPGGVQQGPAERQSRTDCVEPLAFEGETTLAALGLGDIPNMRDDAGERGLIRITEETVTWAEFAPPGVPPVVPEGQLLCITWPDGSGVTTMLHEPFDPQIAGVGGRGDSIAPPPLVALVVGAAILIIAVLSWLAYRRDSA